MTKRPGYLEVEIGKKFGELTVVGEAVERRKSQVRKYFLCRCSCGKKKYVDYFNLKTGRSKSCGHTVIESDRVTFRGKKMSIRRFTEKTDYSYAMVSRFLHDGISPEEILKKKKFERKRPTKKYGSKIIVDTLGYDGVEGLANQLGVSRSRLYQRYKAGEHLEKVGGKLKWVKNKK